MTHKVVRNDEEQYSLWPAGRENPPGWSDTGFAGTEQQCLDHIDEVWTDLRPASLRAALASTAESTR
jgi:MbtH protein